MCSRGSTEGGSSGEEAARQRATPAVDVLGGNPQAAQNVAGESPRHAPQPVAAAPRPVPPFTNPSTVPLPESNDSAFLGMEKTNLPETLPTGGVSKDSIAEEESGVLPTSLNEDCGSSAEMLPAPLCPPLAPDTQIDSTVQELQYGSQTDKEKSHSKNSQTNQIQPPRDGAGLVVITGTKEKQSVTLEYKPETGTNMEEHTGGNILPQSQICFTASSPSVPQSSVAFKVQDAAEHGATEQTVLTNQGSHIPPSPLPSSDEIKQTKTQPKVISNDTRETQKANSLESVEMFERVKELVDGGVESSMRDEQTDTTSSDFTTLPECSSTQESPSKPSAAPPLFVEAETSHPSDQLPTTETPLTAAELVHSAEAQEIVVVREEAHISGDWSNMHLNQSYLLQREDGSVCEAAIVNELSSGEPKLYEESVQADIELHSQPVEVYEFCTLVEEVAEETVCASSSSSSAQVPHSPGYEVNLFNALLEHSEEYTVKEDLETSIHTLNESGIISQQPVPSLHDANQVQAHSNSHNLSVESAAVGQHLVLKQAVEVANSSEVCLVEVAAVTSDSFAVEQAGTSPQIVTPCSQVNASHTEVSDSAVTQTQKAESFISPAEEVDSKSLNQTVVSATKHEGTKDAPALTETPSQSVSAPTVTKPEAPCTTRSSGFINPKLLILKPGQTPVLKHPPSLLAQVSRQQNAAGKLANAHSSVSEQCLPQKTVSDSLCASGGQKDQAQCSVNKTSVSAASPTPSGDSPSVTATTSTSRSDKEALNVTETSSEASQDVVTPTDATTPNALYSLSASVESEGVEMASTSLNDPASQPDSLYAEEESEDMEQDEPTEENEAQEAASEEGSDEEPDADNKTESEMTTPGSPDKVLSSYFCLLNLFYKVAK